MANTVPMITPGSIIVDRGLADRPVYFVRVNGVGLVIKGDAKGSEAHERSDQESEISIKWSSKLMKNVNNELVNTKIMTPAEVAVFLQAAVPVFPNPSRQLDNVTVQAQTYTWIKMPMVQGLSDADFLQKNDRGRVTGVISRKVKEDIVKFTDEAMWPPLGKILAVDIFNGNNDRFDTATGDWINLGNVMFLQGGDTPVIGLDTFDPMGTESNLVRVGGFDTLRTLIDAGRRITFAQNCVKSVGSKLSSALFERGASTVTIRLNRPDGPVDWTVTPDEVKNLYLGFAPALAAGIERGATQLKDYLQRKVREYRMRAGQPAVPVPPNPLAGRARANVGIAAAPPRPTAAAFHATPVPGIPQGLLDRMAFLHWLD